MSIGLRLAGAAVGVLVGLQAATQFLGWTFGYASALGPGLPIGRGLAYPPWSVLTWKRTVQVEEPRVFSAAMSLVMLGGAAGLGLGALVGGPVGTRRRRGWGGLQDAAEAGLLARAGCVVGELGGRVLITADLRPSLVTGGTRSGKGRGHVVPSLLSWTESALVHDPKGELWRFTAGWRSRFSHVLRFDPRSADGARWNPLAEIHPGPGELAQVQRLVAILADPGGVRDDEAIWDKSASEILEAVILHVLYTADDADKTLIKVRELIADLDAAADLMLKTLHRPGADGAPETHPFIKTAVTGYNAGPGRVARLGRVPEIRETKAYVEAVVECYLALSAGRGVRNSRECLASGGPR